MRRRWPRREFLKTVALGTAAFESTYAAAARAAADNGPPNIIVILCDNLGYGDIGCFGSTPHRTPNVDRLAAEGMRLTSFYSTSGVCTPSRASLMTGCYPRRVSMHVGAEGGLVLRPGQAKGLNPDEITIAEILKQRDYATACIGKWHLGDQPEFLPTRQGFERYFGIPYSDDMVAAHNPAWPPLPLMRNEEVIEAPVDRNTLTRRYTHETVRFIRSNRNRPFFLYLAHAMPGSTTHPFASERFRGRSANGPYGDSVEEIDWSAGRILEALAELGLDETTLVVWTSDNGAPRRNPPQGSNGPLAGWGYTATEGGMRVPCVVRWPGRIPAGTTCDELTTTMDLLPTFAHLAGATPPDDRRIDGKDIRPMLFGEPRAASPYEAFFYYHKGDLQAVRSGKWKLQLPPQNRGNKRTADNETHHARLYDLQKDIGETTDLSATHPEIVQRLLAFAEQAREDLGDGERKGANQRPAGWVKHPTVRTRPKQTD